MLEALCARGPVYFPSSSHFLGSLQAQNITSVRICRPSSPPTAYGGGLTQPSTCLCCRLCIKEDPTDDRLRHLLPPEEGSPIEKAAEEALNLRM